MPSASISVASYTQTQSTNHYMFQNRCGQRVCEVSGRGFALVGQRHA
jgi:hypothetical protein